MAVINVGSINLDYVYRVPHLVAPGETLAATSLQTGLGGKGLNQSIAMLRAGAEVCHVGAIGAGDEAMRARLQETGLALQHVARVDAPTGHALIQVDDQAENAILLFPGANQCLSEAHVQQALDAVRAGWLLLQNETNLVHEAVRMGRAAGCRIAHNPAPFDAALQPDLALIDLLIFNEVEAMQCAGTSDLDSAMRWLQTQRGAAETVVTRGSAGVSWLAEGQWQHRQAPSVTAVDTTGAGDTFCGYLLAGLDAQLPMAEAIARAMMASAIAVTRVGATASIPARAEVEQALAAS